MKRFLACFLMAFGINASAELIPLRADVTTGACNQTVNFTGTVSIKGATAAKNKWDATTAPTVTDDSAAGYSVGSIWVNVTLDNAYICEDATASNAVWKPISLAVGSTDEALIRADGTGGYAVQGSTDTNLSDTGVLSLYGANPLILGKDDATNTAGWMKFWGAGANNYYATLAAPTLTSNAAFLLPVDEPAAESWLTMGTDGQIDYTTISAETLAAVTARGATTATASSFTGGATIYGLTVETAVATEDQIIVAAAAGGAGARIVGTLTNADLTVGAKTWTLPNASGTVAVSATAPATLSVLGDVGVTVTGDIVAGVGLTGGADNVLPGSDVDVTLTFDSTELGTLTWGNNGSASFVWNFDVSGTDTAITFSNGTINVSTGALQVGGAAVLTAEADTLAAVTGRGATTAQSLTLTGATPLELGKDDATNVAGWMKLWSAGANGYYTTFTAAEQSANATYTLPVSMPGSNMVLQSTSAGVLSWVAGVPGSDTLDDVTSNGATTSNASTFSGGLLATDATTALTIGAGTAATDYRILFDGETGDGSVTWMEDESRFDVTGSMMVLGSGITVGSNGTDGSITIYSEQGGTDYSIVFQPHATMTESTTYTMPPAKPTADKILQSDSSGNWTWVAHVGVYRNIWIDAGAMIGRTTTGAESGTDEATTNYEMSDYFAFDQTTSEFVCFRWSPPDEWDCSTVKAKFYWTASSGTPTNTCIWGIQAIALSNDDPIDTAYGTAVTVSDALIALGDIHVTAATAAITVGGTPALGDIVYWQVYRDISDTLDADAKLLGVMIQYHEGSDPAAW